MDNNKEWRESFNHLTQVLKHVLLKCPSSRHKQLQGCRFVADLWPLTSLWRGTYKDNFLWGIYYVREILWTSWCFQCTFNQSACPGKKCIKYELNAETQGFFCAQHNQDVCVEPAGHWGQTGGGQHAISCWIFQSSHAHKVLDYDHDILPGSFCEN